MNNPPARESAMRRVVLLFLLCSAVTLADAAEPLAPKFVVFFQEWSAALDPAALAVISHASDYAKANSISVVYVDGFADPAGSRKANLLLTDLRAQVVIDRLQADGVPGARIRGRGHGPVRFALTSQESRRVEISVGGQ
jgi:outer membrane protein OmpA-like peptidoglycan-associated protein